MSESSGKLVWVRRRNGTWWPGQILSVDQLPESIMSSGRSGTPVKLLGREYAMVEWFNIEKSKRIKKFRCPEFKECIEEAEACKDNLTKRPGNFARRRDAIYHALQRERAEKSEVKPEHDMKIFFYPSISGEEIGQKCIISLKGTNSKEKIPQNTNINSQDTSEDFSRSNEIQELRVGVASRRKRTLTPQAKEFWKEKEIQELRVGVASRRKRTLTPLAKEFWKEKGILSAEPVIKRHCPGSSLMHGSGASQKLQVGCQGHQAQSFFSEDFNNPCQSTSGSEPRNVNAGSNLFEVNVEADTGYKAQNVPFICLKSRSNGWSILGHPVNVEVLDDGYGDQLKSGYISSSDDGKEAPYNRAYRRGHGKHNLSEPAVSSRFLHPWPASPAPKKLRRVSSLLASHDTSPSQIIPGFKNIEKLCLNCVPLNLIYSRLKEGLH